MTGGTNEGVMKLVGKAVRDYSLCEEGESVTCIAISPWGMVNGSEKLVNPQN